MRERDVLCQWCLERRTWALNGVCRSRDCRARAERYKVKSAARALSATGVRSAAGEAPSRPAFPASYSPGTSAAPVSASSCVAPGDLLEGAGS